MEPTGPTSRPSPRPTLRRRLTVGLAFAVLARPASPRLRHNTALFLRGLVADRPAAAVPRATRVSGSP